MESPAHGRYACSGANVQAFSVGSKLYRVQKLTVGKIYDVGGRDIDVQVFWEESETHGITVRVAAVHCRDI